MSRTNLYCIHDNGEIWPPRCQPLPLHTLGHKRGYKLYLSRILQQSAEVGLAHVRHA